MEHPYAGPAGELKVGQVITPPDGVCWGEPGAVEVVREEIFYVDRFCVGVQVECLMKGRPQTHFCVRERSFVDVIVVDQDSKVYLGLQRRPNDAGVPRIQGFAGSIEKEEGLRVAAEREFEEEFKHTYGKITKVVEVVPLGFWTQNDSKLGDLEPKHNQPNGHPSCKYGFGLLVRVEIIGDVPEEELEKTEEVIDRLPPMEFNQAMRYAFIGAVPAGKLGEQFPAALRCDNGDTTNLIFRAWLYWNGFVGYDVEQIIANLPFPIKF